MYEWRVLEVVKVVDGDTVDLRIDRGFYDSSVIRFRLVGVDTPETRGASREAGLASKAWTAEWLTSHAQCMVVDEALMVASIKSGSTPDGGFGRWLGDVWCEKCESESGDGIVSLSQALIDAGMAVKR